ncbi:MAG: alpha/beta hydrolase [Candidatus Aenigmatarchaeota archaeon]
MDRKVIASIAFILLLCGCVKEVAMETKFETDDGFIIYADFYQPEKPNGKALILLHMLRTDKSHWRDFAEELRKNGYHVLAIDLRGHGKSIIKQGQKITWENFSEKDFKNMVLDVKAAKLFLIENGVNEKSVGIIGASIGANTALNYAATDEEIKVVVLLSPGLNYRGVTTMEALSNYNRPLLIVASKEDEPSASSSQKLYEMAMGEKFLKIYENAGHGTNMFSKTDLNKVIIDWLENHFN